jgi:hypothetical protein
MIDGVLPKVIAGAFGLLAPLIVAASGGARFTNTINLGAILLGIIIVSFFGISTWRDRLSKRWRDLYELADQERKELSGKCENLLEELHEAKELISKLDALQMPIRIVELMNESVDRIDKHAQARLEKALGELRGERREQDARDQKRHDELLKTLGEVRAVLAVHRQQ